MIIRPLGLVLVENTFHCFLVESTNTTVESGPLIELAPTEEPNNIEEYAFDWSKSDPSTDDYHVQINQATKVCVQCKYYI